MGLNEEKSIGIYDIGPENHYIYTYTACKIFELTFNKVYIFCSKDIYDKVSNMDINMGIVIFVVKSDNEKIKDYLKRIKIICNKELNILWVNTIQGNISHLWKHVLFKTNCYQILTIHNVKNWFNNDIFIQFKTKYNFMIRVKNISHFILRKLILKNYNAISVLEENLRTYIAENNLYNGKVFCMPFSSFDISSKEELKLQNENKKNFVKLVIPGMISAERRDYLEILDILSEKEFMEFNIKVVLLGRPTGKSSEVVIEKCDRMKREGFDISYYKGFIDETQYIKEIIDCDFILADMMETINVLGNLEVYGLTKSTGVFFNMIRFAKPGIVPEWYKVDEKLRSSIFKYKNKSELRELLLKVNKMDSDQLLSIKRSAISNSEKFTIDIYKNLLDGINNESKHTSKNC